MENSAVVGFGIIGKATATAFGIKKHFDTLEERSNCSLNEVADCRYVFICVPTPTVNGDCDASAIRDIIRQIEEIRSNPIYIIRSTVTPGTADALMTELGIDRIISNPEFLSEDTWENDIKSPDLIVIGGKIQEYLSEVVGIYKARYKGVNIFLTNNVTAEMIKYAINCFFSTKVVYANAIYDICQRVGANYETLKNAMYSNSNIGKNHLTIWYKNGRGVRGRCLPKDLEAFANWSNKSFLKSVLMESYMIPEGKDA